MNHFERGIIVSTNMKRTTVSFTDELTDRIFSLRADARFRRCSYSELIRQLAEKGLEMLELEQLRSEAAAPGLGLGDLATEPGPQSEAGIRDSA